MDCPLCKTDFQGDLKGLCFICNTTKGSHKACRLSKKEIAGQMCPICNRPKDNHEDQTILEKLREENVALKQRACNWNSIANDPRSKAFSEEGSDNTPKFKDPPPWWRRCCSCGTRDNVNRAHILTNKRKIRVDVMPLFGTGAGYANDIQPAGFRNHIPLCGTKGEEGTCHHDFYHGNLTLLYDPFRQLFFFYGATRNKNKFSIAAKFHPYRRLLVWRARRDALNHHDSNLFNLASLTDDAHASEASQPDEPPHKKKRLEKKSAKPEVVVGS